MSRVDDVIAEQDRSRPIAEFDVVHLKSGGPSMTVSSIASEVASCRWFDKEGRLRQEQCKIGELRRGPHQPIPVINFQFGSDEAREQFNKAMPPWMQQASEGEQK